MSRYVFMPKGTETKFKILHSIDRPVDKISVGDICSNAHISRQAFYNHFESKYQIAYWFFDLVNNLYLSHIGRDMDWDDAVFGAMKLIDDERPYLINAFAENPHDNEVEPFLEDWKEHLIETLRDYCTVEMDDEMFFYVDFYISQGNQLIVDWCLSEEGVSPETAARYFTGCAPSKLREALQRSRSTNSSPSPPSLRKQA